MILLMMILHIVEMGVSRLAGSLGRGQLLGGMFFAKNLVEQPDRGSSLLLLGLWPFFAACAENVAGFFMSQESGTYHKSPDSSATVFCRTHEFFVSFR